MASKLIKLLLIIFLSSLSLYGQEIDSLLLKEIEIKFSVDEPVILPFEYGFVDCFSGGKSARNEIILNTIFVFLQNHDSEKIAIISHTDCRGNDDYNEKLSLQMARNIRKWLLERKISGDRILARGKGEKSPLIQCENCSCPDEVHWQNKRVVLEKV